MAHVIHLVVIINGQLHVIDIDIFVFLVFAFGRRRRRRHRRRMGDLGGHLLVVVLFLFDRMFIADVFFGLVLFLAFGLSLLIQRVDDVIEASLLVRTGLLRNGCVQVGRAHLLFGSQQASFAIEVLRLLDRRFVGDQRGRAVR